MARASSTRSQRLPLRSFRSFATLLLTVLLTLISTVAFAVGEEPGGGPPRPPGMADDATYAHPKLQFQVHSQTKDTTALALAAGWNLVSLPLEPYDPAIASVLGSIAGSFDQVWVYDGCDPADPWRFYDPLDAAASNLASLDHRLGFWIHLTTDAILNLDGDPPVDTSTPICTGWNLIGHPRNGALPVAGALVSITGSVDRVFGFEPGAGAAGWRFWSSDTPSWVHDLDQLTPGRGYWVLANADATYVAADPEPPPAIGALDLLEGQEITAPTTISATIASNAEVAWTLAHRPEGESEWTEFASGTGPTVNAELDPTLLLNGIYEVRLDVADVFGQTTTAEGNVQVAGAMKPGVVTLTFADMTVSMAGLPITVLRTYDSRDKSVGDFGYGWRLELAKGTYRNNRPPGEGWMLTGSVTGNPQTPCYSSVETLGHFTDIRLGDQDAFRFAVTYDAYGFDSVVNGGCSGDARFVQIGGRPGATLDILGNTEVFYAGQTTQLLDASTFELYDPQRVLLTTPEGLEYVIDRDDGVLQVADSAGQTLTFADNGIHHSDGRSVFFDRDAEGRIRYLVDPIGRTVSYTYDDAGDLVAVTDVLAETLRFEYHSEIPHHLERILDNEGQLAQELVYDAEGRMVLTCAGDGDCVETSHDLGTQTETLYDAMGRPTILVYDDRGQVVSRTDALGNSTTYDYDGDGRLTEVIDALGGVSSTTYDERGNPIAIVEPHGPGDDPADYTTVQTFDLRNRRTGIDFPGGGGYRFSYGSSAKPAEMTDSEGNVLASFTFDVQGRVVAESGPFGTDQYVLDGTGNVLQSTDVFGRTSTMTYDALGQVSRIVESSGQVSTFERDSVGRMTEVDLGHGVTVNYDYGVGPSPVWTRVEGPTLSTVERLTDGGGGLEGFRRADGGEVRLTRDSSGRRTSDIDPLGRVTSYGYDAAGRLTSLTDPRGGTTTLTLDPLGRVISTSDPLGNSEQRTYRPDGHLTSLTNALGRTWTFDYGATETLVTDPLGRESRMQISALGLPIAWTFADGSQTSTEYLLTSPLVDADQFPTRTTDELGRSRLFAYDNFGRLVQATDEAGAETTYAWAEELLVSITGPTGASRSFTYDERDNIASMTLEDGGVVQRLYGPDNRLATEIRPSGVAWGVEYDELGRVVSRQASTGESIGWTWNSADEMVAMVDATGTTQRTYDPAGELASMTFPDGSSVVYTRDLLGRVTEVTVEGPGIASQSTLYAYDAVGNLVSLTDPLGGVTSWTYDPVDRPVSRTLPNGIVTTWTYDLRDRLVSVVHQNAVGVVLASATTERSASGEPTTITYEDGSRVELSYDAGLRLASESFFDPGGLLEEVVTYTYDAAGNRTSRSDGAGLSTYGYDPGHRLVSVSGASAESYTYDADGRRVSMTREGATQTLSWNADDRLTGVVEGGTTLATYTHDGAQRRVAASGATERRFVVAPTVGDGLDAPHLVTDGSGTLAASFVWAGEEPLLRHGSAGTAYYLTDGMGSVLALADSGGGSLARYRYDGFGNLRSATGSESEPPSALGGDFRFHGAWLEEATGLYHLRARDYDPRTGLFLSRDPVDPELTRPEALHPYVFADGNPHLYRDPTGLFTLVEINISINLQSTFTAVRAGMVNLIRDYATEAVGDLVTNLLFQFVEQMLGVENLIESTPREQGQQGREFERQGSNFMCEILKSTGYDKYIYLEVPLKGNGEPISDGINCRGRGIQFRGLHKAKPDFLISPIRPYFLRKQRRRPREPRPKGKSYLVGDFKIRTTGNLDATGQQFATMVSHALNYQYIPIVLYATWYANTPGKNRELLESAVRRGAIVLIVDLERER